MKGDNRMNAIHEMLCYVVMLCGGDATPWEERAQTFKDLARNKWGNNQSVGQPGVNSNSWVCNSSGKGSGNSKGKGSGNLVGNSKGSAGSPATAWLFNSLGGNNLAGNSVEGNSLAGGNIVEGNSVAGGNSLAGNNLAGNNLAGNGLASNSVNNNVCPPSTPPLPGPPLWKKRARDVDDWSANTWGSSSSRVWDVEAHSIESAPWDDDDWGEDWPCTDDEEWLASGMAGKKTVMVTEQHVKKSRLF